MSDVVQFRPGQIEAATATLSGNLNTITQQNEDRIQTGVQYINAGSGQFTDRFNEVNNDYARVSSEQQQTIQQIITAINEAKASNAARDARSAASIG